MPLDAGTCALRGRQGLLRGRVEVSDGDRDLEAERMRMVEATIGCDDRRPCGRFLYGVADRRLSTRHNHDDLLRHAFLRWHYPDQVLRVGGALVRPLSPAAP